MYKLLLLLLFQTTVYASEIKWLEAEHLSMQYRDLRSFERWKMRNPYLYPNDEEIRYGLALDFDWNIVQYKKYKLFWKNEWAYYSEETHVRDVYWDFKLGVTIIPNKINVYYRHKSEHILDLEREQRFPVIDEGVIELIFINK